MKTDRNQSLKRQHNQLMEDEQFPAEAHADFNEGMRRPPLVTHLSAASELSTPSPHYWGVHLQTRGWCLHLKTEQTDSYQEGNNYKYNMSMNLNNFTFPYWDIKTENTRRFLSVV